MNSKTSTKRALKAVKSFLSEQKWGQESFYNDNTQCFCIVGAMSKALLGNVPACALPDLYYSVTDVPSLVERVRHALDEALPTETTPTVGPAKAYFGRLYSFNDALGRTKADVLALLDRAISHA